MCSCRCQPVFLVKGWGEGALGTPGKCGGAVIGQLGGEPTAPRPLPPPLSWWS